MPINYYYHSLSPPSKFVSMVIKHLDLDVNHFVIDLTKGEQKNPEYLKINEAGQVPAIDDDGFKLGESRAIAAYLCNKYAPDSELYPKDPKKRAQVDRLLYFDAGTLFPTTREVIFPPLFFDKEPSKEAIDELKRKIALLNTLIGDKKYLTGDHVTLADYAIFIVGFYLENKCKSFDLSEFPNVKKWVETLSNEHPHAVEILSNLDGIEEFRAAIMQRMGLPK